MKSEREYREFVEIEDLSLLDRIRSSALKTLASGLTYFESFVNYISGKSGNCDPVLDIQSSYYDEEGERIYRRVGFGDKLCSAFKNMQTIPEIFLTVATANRAKTMLGFREVLEEEIIKDEDLKPKILLTMGPYIWLSYEQVYNRVIQLAYYLSQKSIEAGSKVLIFADTGADWLIMALAVMLLRATVVTIFPSLTDEYVLACIKLTEPSVVFLDRKGGIRLDNMLSQLPFIRNVLYSTTYRVDGFAFKNLEGEFMKVDSIYAGDSPDKSFLDSLPSCQPEDLAVIMFTSGSTGMPKGVMLRQRNIVSTIIGADYGEDFLKDHVYPGFLPLSHIFEICVELYTVFSCGVIGYCNPGTLFDSSPMLSPKSKSDFSLLKPTRMSAVPLVLERIFKNFKAKLKSMPRAKRVMFQTLYNTKAQFVSRGYSTKYIDVLFSNKFLQLFGGRLEFIISAGSFLPRDIQEFFNIVFCKLVQGYGATETCCGGAICTLNYDKFGSIGAPFSCSEIKLIPWPEGGYEESGVNIKRGEILISGNAVSSGYYKNEKLTKESFEFDQKTNKVWFHTSDIAELMDDLTFKIIGRKSEVVKLAHGEFVQLLPIESAICSSKYINFACVTPDGDNRYLIAILCLNPENIVELAESLDYPQNLRMLALLSKDPNIQNIIKDDIGTYIKKNPLLDKHHRPSKYIFTGDQWTPETNLVTPSLKVKRFMVLKQYKEIIAKE